MQLDSSKEKSLLFWFNTYGASINLNVVDSLTNLWLAHVPSLLNCLRTNNNKKVESTHPTTTYNDLYSHLLNTSDQNTFVESLSVEKAAEGDVLEIAKFLAVLLNELRISNPDVITESVAVMERESQDEPLREIFAAFDEDESDWWSVMISRSDLDVANGGGNSYFVTPRRPSLPPEEFSGMSVNRSMFVTPCGPNRITGRRNNTGAYTVARCDSSPLMDAVNSPKVRELRRDREIKTLKKQLDEMEDQLMLSDSRAAKYRRELESLIAEVSSKKERIRELEGNEKLLQRSRDELEDKQRMMNDEMEKLHCLCASQKQRIAMYKSGAEKWEEKENQLNEKLKLKDSALAVSERKLRDINDELLEKLQTVHTLETERDNLATLLDEAKRVAEAEREQYQASVSEWRRRCETETSDKMSLYSYEMEKNAALQRELREQTEKMESLQKQYEESKRMFESTIKENEKVYRENHDSVAKRLAEVEAELAAQEERHKCFVSEQTATVRQLESAHLTDAAQRDSKIRSSRIRIDELEASLAECTHVILQQRKELSTVAAERDAAEAERSLLRAALDQKEFQLCEATTISEKLKAQIDEMEAKCCVTTQSMENLQADCARLKAHVDAKDTEISGLQMRIEDLMSISDARNDIAQELEKTRQELYNERKRFTEQESLIKTTAENLKQKLEELTARNSHQAALITHLENSIEVELDLARKEEEQYRAECEALRRKELLRTEQLQDLCKKFDKIEEDLCLYNKRNSELELQIVQLKEENAQFYKCIELSNIKADKELIKKRFPNASASKGTLRRTLERVPSPTVNSIFLLNEEEPSVCQMSTTDSKWVEMEGVPITNPAAQKPPRPKSPSKADLAKHRSNLSLPNSSSFGSMSSLKKSNSKGSLQDHIFALAASATKAERRDFKLDTDRTRIAELQQRNAKLHPAMRCAYGPELGAYNSPTGSENTMKHGSARRKSGANFFQRASSYVKKKRHPLSEVNSSHQ